MKRWATHLFISTYLGVLAFGLAAHALTFLKTSHPAMYFIVWDMYCSWSSYELRLHILGEGDSGQLYALSPAPWGDFKPFDSARRQDYDTAANFGYRLAANTLAHTDHEPIRRILVVEEGWPKKYNIRKSLWEHRFGTPKPETPHSYYHVRRVYNAAGDSILQANCLLNELGEAFVLDNPKLRADMHRGKTFYASDPRDRNADVIQPVGFTTDSP